MTIQPGFKIPAWVPKPVQDKALSLLTEAPDDRARLVIKRLLTDSRMRAVWRELTKQRRNRSTYKPAMPYYRQESGPFRLYDYKVTLNNLESFFSDAYSLAVNAVSIMTRDEVLEARAALLTTTKQFEDLALQLRRWHTNEDTKGHFNTHLWALTLPKSQPLYVPENLRFSQHWKDLNHVADELDKFALYFIALTEIISPSRGAVVIQRRTADDKVRAYVLKLSGNCKSSFGSFLHSTIATTATVALNKKVLPSYVKRAVQSLAP